MGSRPRVWFSEDRETKHGVHLVLGVRLTLTDNSYAFAMMETASSSDSKGG